MCQRILRGYIIGETGSIWPQRYVAHVLLLSTYLERNNRYKIAKWSF